MPEDDPAGPIPHDPARRRIIQLRLPLHLAPHQPRIDDPVHRRDRHVHVAQAGPQHRHDGNDDHQERDGDEHVDDPPEYRIRPAAHIPQHAAHQRPEQRREHRAEHRDLQVDARRPDRPRQDVTPEIIGPERMRPSRRLQQRRKVERIRKVRCNQVRHHRARHEQQQDQKPNRRRRSRPPHRASRGSSSAWIASVSRNTMLTITASTMLNPCTTG